MLRRGMDPALFSLRGVMAKAKPKTLSWQEQSEIWEKEKRDKRRKTLAELKEISITLFAKGIIKFSCEYNGEGDSGDIEYNFYEKNEAFGPKNAADIPEEVLTQLIDMAWEFVPSGFENNDGGFGLLTINFQTSTIELIHNDRIVEIETKEQNFDFAGEEL